MAEDDNRKLVLVVSDDPLIRHQALFGFPEGVEVRVALEARDALEKMAEETPLLVVVDLQTGNAGGFALARDMRQDRRLGRIPILMLLERSQDAWLALRAGATAHRTKPLSVAELVDQTLALLP